MPHKHTRRKDAGQSDKSFDLPPSSFARPLPASSNKHEVAKTSSTTSRKRKRGNAGRQVDNDTPRAFQRLMAMQQRGARLPSGLDNGERPSKKSKKKAQLENKADGDETSNKPQADSKSVPKILPGERLSEFSARVNQALPLSAMHKSAPGGSARLIKERQTRMEKKLQRMQGEWREQDAKRKEAEQELRDAQAEAEDWQGIDDDDRDEQTGTARRKGKKGRRKSKAGAAIDQDDEDPWAQLAALRGRRPALHDVASAPPQFSTKPREVFKVREGARVAVDSVPAAAGSLRRREALGQARQGVIAQYRARRGR